MLCAAADGLTGAGDAVDLRNRRPRMLARGAACVGDTACCGVDDALAAWSANLDSEPLERDDDVMEDVMCCRLRLGVSRSAPLPPGVCVATLAVGLADDPWKLPMTTTSWGPAAAKGLPAGAAAAAAAAGMPPPCCCRLQGTVHTTVPTLACNLAVDRLRSSTLGLRTAR